ncbi:hypothetical protein AB0H34_27245 [Saccharopolyspora shandongensis]|uniref:hypothetical protein n=1 Tax=Saccharopolyspora shandongensis TaxID=418495 RepID=UPI0033D0A58C
MSEGDGGNPYQTMDQGKIDAMRASGGITGMIGNVMNVVSRATDNAAFAAAQQANGTMRIDLDQLDKIVTFFEDEARELRERRADIADLSVVEPPGGDPVSAQVAEKYALVASGNAQAYLDNYLQLAVVLEETAENLKASVRQTRTDQQNAAEAFGGGDLA